jgi:hypothetical protein
LAQLITDFVDLILAVGAVLYAYKMTVTAKGGVLERGMKLMMFSLVTLLFAIIADMFDDLGFGSVFDIVHDLILAVFILLMFFGLLTMTRDASDFLKSVRP